MIFLAKPITLSMKKLSLIFALAVTILSTCSISAATSNRSDTTPRKAPRKIVEGGWHSIGVGRWYEGLLTIFDQIPYGLNWEIEIDESDEVPGYYRMIPYGADTPVAEAVGAPDNNYFYVDASDPERVYAEEFIAYNGFEYNYWFSHMVPENLWDVERYATLEDNVIYFPPSCFGYFDPETSVFWDVNFEGDFKIVLPDGEDIPNWLTIGESDFTDGCISPYLNGTPTTTRVTVQERHRRPGYYRLLGALEPYGSEEPLIIDATDPDFVIVPYQYTGIIHPERDEIVVYSHCENFMTPTKYPTKAEYAEAFPQYVATMRDGLISIPPDGWVLHFPNYNPLSYTTNDELATETTIRIPNTTAAPTIEATAEGPEQWYDLHGRRVTPTKGGGIYIKKGSADFPGG